MAKTFDDLVSRTMSKVSRKRADQRTKALLREMLLSELRRATGYSQKTLAAKLKMKQPSLSKLENASDMQVTTLQKLVGALGGEVEIVCRFPNGDVRLVQFDRKLRVA
jgi:ribosome-binding protein aMBF1 (putative translation factor)